MEAEINKKTHPVRLRKGLMKKLTQIIEQEKERGYDKCSFANAGEILSKRIDSAGGIKE